MSTTIDSNAPRQPQSKSVYNQEKKKNRAEEIEEKNKQRKSIEISILSKATIVCTTLSSSGHELFSKLTHGFDTVIIDEAAQVCANQLILPYLEVTFPFQAVELSTLIPLRYNCKRCIMVGDPNVSSILGSMHSC
jgi:senataxin